MQQRPTIPLTNIIGAVQSAQYLRITPGTLHLSLLATLGSESLLLHSLARGRIQAEVTRAEAARASAEEAGRVMTLLSSAAGPLGAEAERYLSLELQHRLAAEAYLGAAKGRGGGGPAAPLPAGAQKGGAAAAAADAAAAAARAAAAAPRVRELHAALAALNERVRAPVARAGALSLEDAGVCASSRWALALRMRGAAAGARAALAPPGAEAGGGAWLAALSARAPCARDVLPPGVAHRIAAGAAAGDALAAPQGGGSGGGASEALAPAFARGGGPRGSSVAFLHDAATQQLMNVLAGVIAVARGRMERGAGAPLPPPQQQQPPPPPAAAVPPALSTPCPPPPPPPEVAESAAPAVRAAWTAATAAWGAWYEGERARLEAAFSRGGLAREGAAVTALLPLQSSWPPSGGGGGGGGDSERARAGALPASRAYAAVVADAAHRACAGWYPVQLKAAATTLAAGAVAARVPPAAPPQLPPPPPPADAERAVTRWDVVNYLWRQLSGSMPEELEAVEAAAAAGEEGSGGGGSGALDKRFVAVAVAFPPSVAPPTPAPASASDAHPHPAGGKAAAGGRGKRPAAVLAEAAAVSAGGEGAGGKGEELEEEEEEGGGGGGGRGSAARQPAAKRCRAAAARAQGVAATDTAAAGAAVAAAAVTAREEAAAASLAALPAVRLPPRGTPAGAPTDLAQLFALAPSVCTHRHAAAWLAWGLSRAAALGATCGAMRAEPTLVLHAT
jgi:hypothetical protein